MKVLKIQRQAVIVAAALAVGGLLTLVVSHAATATVGQEAEDGVAAGNYLSATIAGASGGKAVTFGGSSPSETLPVPTKLKAFVGGDSIALVWAPVKDGSSNVTSYNVFRDGTKIATTVADPNAGGTKLGSQYVDKSVADNQNHAYEVQAVAGNQVSPKSPAVSASRPGSSALAPTVTLDASLKTYNSKANDWYAQYGSDIIKTWYPKIAQVIAYPDFTPPTKITVKSMSQTDYDKQYGKTGRSGVTDFATGSIVVSPKATDPANELSLEAVNNAVRIMGGAPTKMPNWSFTGIADYSTFSIYNNCPTFDCRSITADSYFTDKPTAYLFLEWIQSKYDASYIRKAFVASHNNTYDFHFMEFANGNNIDQVWGLFQNKTTKTGTVKNKAQTDKCMDVPNGDMASTALRIWPCNGAVAQKITRHAVPGSSNEMLTVLGKCLYARVPDNTNVYVVGLGDCRNTEDAPGYNYLWQPNSFGSNIKATQTTAYCISVDVGGNLILANNCSADNVQGWITP